MVGNDIIYGNAIIITTPATKQLYYFDTGEQITHIPANKLKLSWLTIACSPSVYLHIPLRVTTDHQLLCCVTTLEVFLLGLSLGRPLHNLAR